MSATVLGMGVSSLNITKFYDRVNVLIERRAIKSFYDVSATVLGTGVSSLNIIKFYERVNVLIERPAIKYILQ